MAVGLIPVAVALAAELVPGLVKWIAGDKAGRVAGQVLDVARAVTGATEPDAVAAALAAKPELAVQLRLALAELELEQERAYLADRQDARARDVAIRAAGQHNYRADVMLTLAFLGLLSIVWAIYLARLDMPGEVLAILNMAAGALLKMIGDAFQFEFGSSRGSKDKDAALGELARMP